jgi:predicted ATPase
VPQLTESLSLRPRLTILATSQEALWVRGEREVPVPPLPLPASSNPSSLTDIRESEVIALRRRADDVSDTAAAHDGDINLTASEDAPSGTRTEPGWGTC